jgi:hypothetical protein
LLRTIGRERARVEQLAEDQVSARLYGERFSTAGRGTPRPHDDSVSPARGSAAGEDTVVQELRARLAELAAELNMLEGESSATERDLRDIVRDLQALAGVAHADEGDEDSGPHLNVAP